MTVIRKAKSRDTALASVDREAPAYRIIYGVFGGLTPFSTATGTPTSTAHEWLKTGLIPARRQGTVLEAARVARLRLDPALFVPTARAA